MCARVCACVCVSMRACVSVRTYNYVCACVCVGVHVCMRVHVCVRACAYNYLHVCQKIMAIYISACGVYVKSVVLFNSACLSGSKQKVEHALCVNRFGLAVRH